MSSQETRSNCKMSVTLVNPVVFEGSNFDPRKLHTICVDARLRCVKCGIDQFVRIPCSIVYGTPAELQSHARALASNPSEEPLCTMARLRFTKCKEYRELIEHLKTSK